MATNQSTVDFILDQLSSLGGASARKMFGEYALYFDGKVVALVCDDQLFVKMTAAGLEFVGDEYESGPAYPGAKPSIIISEDLIDDSDWLVELIRVTANHVEPPKKSSLKKASKS